MAVIITDMQMPAQCCECVFCFRINNESTGCSRKPAEEPVKDGDKRPKYCPLKEANVLRMLNAYDTYVEFQRILRNAGYEQKGDQY